MLEIQYERRETARLWVTASAGTGSGVTHLRRLSSQTQITPLTVKTHDSFFMGNESQINIKDICNKGRLNRKERFEIHVSTNLFKNLLRVLICDISSKYFFAF